MAKPKTVDITKGELRGQCLESAYPAWRRNGWTLVDDGVSESGKEPVDEKPKPESKTKAKADQNEGGDQ